MARKKAAPKKPTTPEEQTLNVVLGILIVCGQSTTEYHPAAPPVQVTDFIREASMPELQGTLAELISVFRQRIREARRRPQP